MLSSPTKWTLLLLLGIFLCGFTPGVLYCIVDHYLLSGEEVVLWTYLTISGLSLFVPGLVLAIIGANRLCLGLRTLVIVSAVIEVVLASHHAVLTASKSGDFELAMAMWLTSLVPVVVVVLTKLVRSLVRKDLTLWTGAAIVVVLLQCCTLWYLAALLGGYKPLF